MIKVYIKAFLDIIFPKACLICEKTAGSEPICKQCQTKLQKDNKIKQKTTYNLAQYYDSNISSAYYNPIAKKLIRLFKYHQYKYLSDFFAVLMKQSLYKNDPEPNSYHAIVNVPSHKTRLRERGYNQTFILAKSLSKAVNKPSLNVLKCNKLTKSQTKLNRAKRLSNIKGAFECFDPDAVKNKNILLVDDVITTSSTVNECAKVLKKSGAKKITVITFAKSYN